MKFNFKGWSFLGWLKGNHTTIEEAIKVLVPWFVASFIVDPIWAQFLITIVGKFILDTIHYWVVE